MYNMITGEHGFMQHAFAKLALLCNDQISAAMCVSGSRIYNVSKWLTYLSVLNKNFWTQLNITLSLFGLIRRLTHFIAPFKPVHDLDQ